MTEKEFQPYIPAERSVPEITLRALVLGGVLAIVMSAANAYLGLRAGMTISASIPAAVVSMAILRGIFRSGTVLENNIAQTMASTGESVAAGAIFTIPALVLVGVWQDFQFWPTTAICVIGCVLGVVFMVPMRRAFIVNRKDLVYPEGLACSEVLIAGQEAGTGAKYIGIGLIVGGLFTFLVKGVGIVLSVVEGAVAVGRSVFYIGCDMSAAMVAVGYIVRLHIAILVFFGGAFGWLIAIPLLGEADPNLSPAEAASALWSTQIRYIGVGAMLVGGLHAIWSVRGGIWSGITALRGVRGSGGGEASAQERTSRDMRLVHLVLILALCAVGTVILYDFLIGSIWAALLAAVLMLLAAFLFVAVATYIVGLVGSSHSPVSGMTICALLFAALVLLVLGVSGDSGILATLGVAGVVACAACTAGDCSQDLKTGYLVGATPVRQQWVEIAGAVLPAFFIAPVLSLLHNAYGIGTGEPNALAAPQAQLFASLAEGVFRSGQLPWDMVGIGIGVAVALLILNIVLRALNVDFQAHVMPVAVGIYLPFSLSVPILIGGFIRYYISRSKKGSGGDMRDAGILFGSGLIAGEALMGIGLAVPIVLGQDLPLMDPFQGLSIVSVILFLVLLAVYGAYARKQEA